MITLLQFSSFPSPKRAIILLHHNILMFIFVEYCNEINGLNCTNAVGWWLQMTDLGLVWKTSRAGSLVLGEETTKQVPRLLS